MTRQAFGRNGQLGELYDAYNDKFLTKNIFFLENGNPRILASDVLKEKINDVAMFVMDTTFREKVDFLKIENDLAVRLF